MKAIDMKNSLVLLVISIFLLICSGNIYAIELTNFSTSRNGSSIDDRFSVGDDIYVRVKGTIPNNGDIRYLELVCDRHEIYSHICDGWGDETIYSKSFEAVPGEEYDYIITISVAQDATIWWEDSECQEGEVTGLFRLWINFLDSSGSTLDRSSDITNSWTAVPLEVCDPEDDRIYVRNVSYNGLKVTYDVEIRNRDCEDHNYSYKMYINGDHKESNVVGFIAAKSNKEFDNQSWFIDLDPGEHKIKLELFGGNDDDTDSENFTIEDSVGNFGGL